MLLTTGSEPVSIVYSAFQIAARLSPDSDVVVIEITVDAVILVNVNSFLKSESVVPAIVKEFARIM